MPRLSELAGTYDLLIVGGGIVGAGLARDAVRRGLTVVLFEKADYGGGTTAGSTRLVHGGLRYLAMLDFGLVRLDLRERETLLRIAPHLVKPLPFLVPFYGRGLFYRAKMRAGMLLYDALSFDKSLPRHRFLTADETRRAEPHLEARGLQGAALYFDAQVSSPERLALENVLDARAHGAVALNYVEVTAAAPDGLRVRDVLDGNEAEVRGRVVVNASGPWFDRVAARLGRHPKPLVRTTKGVHLACPPVSRQANALFSPVDRRLSFVIPWLGHAWVGTTDTDFTSDPAAARATDEDAAYLLRSARAYFPQLGKPYWSNAGVRALVTQKGNESSVSRLHRVRVSPGKVEILGGKITGYRAIAEEATDAACRQLGVRRPCTTADEPLPGAGAADARDDLAGAVAHAVRKEQCQRLSDFLLRRTMLGFTPGQALEIVDAATDMLAGELGWSAARKDAETAAYREWVRESRACLEGL